MFRDVIGHLEDGGYSLKLIMKFLNRTYEQSLNIDNTNSSINNRLTCLKDDIIFDDLGQNDDYDVAIPKPNEIINNYSHRVVADPALTKSKDTQLHSDENAPLLNSCKVTAKRTHNDRNDWNLKDTSTSLTTKRSSSSASSAINNSRKHPKIVPVLVCNDAVSSVSSSGSFSSNSSSNASANATSSALSSLETARLANIARNNQFMASLGIETKKVEEKVKRVVNVVTVGDGTFMQYS
jgi:hypothetical protein